MPLTPFPSQKRATNARSDKFYKECVDAAIEMMTYEQNEGLRASFNEKRINYDLASNKLNPTDVARILNPFMLQGYDFPSEVRNYPLLKPKIDLLVGEEIKRRFDWRVMLRNSDAISEKEEMIKERYFTTMTQYIQGKQLDEQELQKKLKELDKWRLYEAQDIREKMATEILTIQYDQQRLRQQFNRGFEDALIGGEEIYYVNIVGGEPVVRKENPLNVHTIRSGDSPYIEDSDIIVAESFMPIGRVIDDYHDVLKDNDIRKLEQASRVASNPQAAASSAYIAPTNYMEERFNEPIILMPSAVFTEALGGSYDQYGNVRVRRVFWKSLRKIGKMSSFDESGTLQYDYVDENFKPDENAGQQVEWIWVTEWLQAALIGDDTYLNLKPYPRIGTSMSNPSKCMSPFVGTIYNIGVNSAMSLMSYGKSYQYLYNLIMHNTEQAVIRSRGVIPIIPAHLMPDGWTIEDMLYYISSAGIIVEDAFREGKKGASQGKLAGMMQRGADKLDLTNAAYIQQNVAMLQIIKAQIDDITGVSPQRQGQIESRELVGAVERSVSQSSHITEKWFSLHDNTKLRVLEAILELTRYAWRNDKKKRQYVLSDMSAMMLDFDGEQFATGEYGIFMSNASSDMELFGAMKQLASQALQSKILKFSDVMSIFMDNSTSSIRRRIETSESEVMQAAEQQAKAEQESKQREIESKAAQVQQADDTKRYIADLDARVKLVLGGEPNDDALELAKLVQADEHHQDEVAVEQEGLQSQERMNERNAQTKELQIKEQAKAKRLQPQKPTAK